MCCKTYVQVITLSNYKQHRQSRIKANKCLRRTWNARKCMCESLTSDWIPKWREFVSQSISLAIQNEGKCESRSTREWKLLRKTPEIRAEEFHSGGIHLCCVSDGLLFHVSHIPNSLVALLCVFFFFPMLDILSPDMAPANDVRCWLFKTIG